MRAMLFLCALAGVAHAEPEVIATQPIALATRGLEVSYERELAPRWSWMALAGARIGAAGDYDSATLTGGGELRWWIRHAPEMRGPYVGAHVSLGRTTVTNSMREIGASLGVTERIDVGWRWVIRDTVAITPALGIGAIEDIDESGRLATVARPTFAFGLEVGWYRRNR